MDCQRNCCNRSDRSGCFSQNRTLATTATTSVQNSACPTRASESRDGSSRLRVKGLISRAGSDPREGKAGQSGGRIASTDSSWSRVFEHCGYDVINPFEVAEFRAGSKLDWAGWSRAGLWKVMFPYHRKPKVSRNGVEMSTLLTAT